MPLRFSGQSQTPSKIKELKTGETPYADITYYGAVGDGETDDRAAIQAAIDAVAPDGVVFAPAGTYLSSGPVNLKGASLVGASPFQTTFIPDETADDTQYQIGLEPNDVALIYSMNEDYVRVSNIGVDGRGRYLGGICFFGGSHLMATGNYVTETANSNIQFMGTRGADINPIRHGVMAHNICEQGRWNLVADGENYSISISDNLSLDAGLRHISLDPQESVGPTRIENAVVANNVCDGYMDIPSTWSNHPSPNSRGEAIRTKQTCEARIDGNYFRGWDPDASNGGWFANLTGSQIEVVNNTFRQDTAAPINRGIRTDSHLSPSVIRNNTFVGMGRGVTSFNGETEALVIRDNQGYSIDNIVFGPGSTPPEAWSVGQNFDEGGVDTYTTDPGAIDPRDHLARASIGPSIEIVHDSVTRVPIDGVDTTLTSNTGLVDTANNEFVTDVSGIYRCELDLTFKPLSNAEILLYGWGNGSLQDRIYRSAGGDSQRQAFTLTSYMRVAANGSIYFNVRVRTGDSTSEEIDASYSFATIERVSGL